MTKVKVDLGYTRNMGNFESLRVDIGVEDDLRDGENVEQGFNRVYSYVEKKLVEKVQETEEELNDKGD
jgi:hypothetical protein